MTAQSLLLDADSLPWLSIRELAALIQSRKLSPVEVVQAMLDRIERLDPALKVFITLTPEKALAEAREAERHIAAGRYRGPLHGVPVAHKDTYKTRNVRTTAHSRLYLNYVPDEDAAVVAQWAAAGAISLGKTNTYELASGREQQLFGIPRNPWKMDRVTGGSSSGSGGGVAAGMFYGASGTDGGGSIRAPAAHCGVVGLRPTFGLVSHRGTLGSGGSTSCCGPLARSVDDVAILLQPLARQDPRDPNSLRSPVGVPDYSASLTERLDGIRIGVPSEYFMTPANCAPDVLAAVRGALSALETLGAHLVEVDLPHASLTDAFYEVIVYAESAAEYRAPLQSRPEDFGFSTRLNLETGLRITAAQYLQSQQLRTLVERDFLTAFQGVDLIVSPTAYTTAREPGDDAKQGRPHPRRPIGLSGGPSISVPCGVTEEGLPVGLQIAGRPWEDATVLRAAHAYSRAYPLDQRPVFLAADSEVLAESAAPPAEDVTTGLVDARYELISERLDAALQTTALTSAAPAVRFRPSSGRQAMASV